MLYELRPTYRRVTKQHRSSRQTFSASAPMSFVRRSGVDLPTPLRLKLRVGSFAGMSRQERRQAIATAPDPAFCSALPYFFRALLFDSGPALPSSGGHMPSKGILPPDR